MEKWCTTDSINWPRQGGDFAVNRQALVNCEGQILKITQSISDSCQAAKPQRRLLALLNFSKAYGRMWREEFLLAESSKGLTFSFARCLRNFLSNLTASTKNLERCQNKALRVVIGKIKSSSDEKFQRNAGICSNGD